MFFLFTQQRWHTYVLKKNYFVLTVLIVFKFYIFFKKLKYKKGSFLSYFTGEIDSRINYCILTICSLYNILTSEISKNCEYYIRNVQTKDGSFSGNKSKEGHSSFFFCCIASLIFFSQTKKSIIVPMCFNNWLLQKEKFFDFSFQGRTSKLTDCCYYFWLGASFIICSMYLPEKLLNSLIFSKSKINFGYSDKIGRAIDLYHTCYALCGLSIFNFQKKSNKKNILRNKATHKKFTSKLNPVYGIREYSLVFFFIE
jgi:protein farnesyltransferase subunit beta